MADDTTATISGAAEPEARRDGASGSQRVVDEFRRKHPAAWPHRIKKPMLLLLLLLLFAKTPGNPCIVTL